MSLVYTQTAMSQAPSSPCFLAPLPGLCCIACSDLSLISPRVEIIGMYHYTSLYGAGYQT